MGMLCYIRRKSTLWFPAEIGFSLVWPGLCSALCLAVDDAGGLGSTLSCSSGAQSAHLSVYLDL